MNHTAPFTRACPTNPCIRTEGKPSMKHCEPETALHSGRHLQLVRRGGYEALKVEIGTNPDRAPDFGPAKVGKAGATIIGARAFLVAFNAYLNTSDVRIARKIARAIRNSNGGFRYLKALGLSVAGQAQVSMNFTNFKQTPIHRVMVHSAWNRRPS